MMIDGFCELTLEAEDDDGDRSSYVRDPEGNMVEVWDHFCRGRTVRDLDDSSSGASTAGQR
jgi:hypothetical protein